MRNIKWLVLAAVLTAGPVWADEGMWTFDNFPSATVAQEIWRADRSTLARPRAQEASCGCPTARPPTCRADGLILTNHHCAEECLADNSTPEHSLIETGFLAADRSQEKKCGTQIADTLVEMENITASVNAATRGQDAKSANEVRKRTLTALEQSCEEASKKSANAASSSASRSSSTRAGSTSSTSTSATTDVRLVFAPEVGIAAFGGDPDNFQFPRYCLDMSVMRAYENGKPAHTPEPPAHQFQRPQGGRC